MFRRYSSFVCLSCGFATLSYSHERHAKKKAPIISCDSARESSEVWLTAIRERMHAGIAFSCFSFVSLFLYARYCRARIHASCPPSSRVGLGCPSLLKVATTLLMVLQIVEAAKALGVPRANHPLQNRTGRCLFRVRLKCNILSIVAKRKLGRCACFLELLVYGQRQKQGGHPGDNFVRERNYL